jgi:hypothetical protein
VVWDCLIFGLFWLRNIQYSANVTIATIACNDVCRESRRISFPRTSCFTYYESDQIKEKDIGGLSSCIGGTVNV